MKHLRRLIPVAALAIGVAAASTVPITGAAHASLQRASVSGKVAFLFSDFTTSARWQFDRQFYIQALRQLDPGIQVIVKDAHAVQNNQQNEAKAVLTQGVKLIVDVPVDSVQASIIVRDAHQNRPRVPVIAYDRLIQGAREDAYASFDGFSVGVQQAKFLKQHLAKGATIVEIAGSPTDNNAHLFHMGARSVLDPLFKSGYFKLGYFKFTPNWDPSGAQQEMASALNTLKNNVQGVLSANDGMAGGIIAALTAQHLNGKVVVTGQDATDAGLQQICLGNQSMTVYKPLRKLANAAATITDKLLRGQPYHGNTKPAKTGAGPTPTFLAPVVTVTKKNILQTVIKDHFTTKQHLAPQCHL